MLTRAVRVRLLAFLLVGLLAVGYLAVRYVRVGQLVGIGSYTVHIDLTQAGGIFTNAEVDYRGVPIGRVGGMRFTSTGIQVDAVITSDDRIPRNVLAVVADRSVIGEQYLDLRPRTRSGPWLRDGSTVSQGNTQLPPPVDQLLMSAEALARSVPIGALQTTLGELRDATTGLNTTLSTLITSSSRLVTGLNSVLPQTIDLITSSQTVLGTQISSSAAIRQFATNLRLIGAQLRASDGDLSTLLERITPATAQVTDLFGRISGPLHDLLANLLTTSAVFYGHQDSLRDLLVNLPVAVDVGGRVVTPQGINVGLVPTFFSPLPCVAGYGATAVRSGLATTGDPPLNTAASCTAPNVDLRGSRHAPTGNR